MIFHHADPEPAPAPDTNSSASNRSINDVPDKHHVDRTHRKTDAAFDATNPMCESNKPSFAKVM